jgi:putative lipoic acid-binding regulatory protein
MTDPQAPGPTPPATPSLIEYPTEFPIKIMGLTRAGFAQAVVELVRRHAADFDGATVEMKPSKHGKYLSITCTINATSREQLDNLYRELCDHPMVVMVL